MLRAPTIDLCRARGFYQELAACLLLLILAPATSFGQANCAPPLSNPIVCENALTGNPQSEWDIIGAGDPTIQGFGTSMSVNHGQAIAFKVNTTASAYRIDIYRLGYYGGLGARKVATVTPAGPLPLVQPPCIVDSSTSLMDCGNW